MKQRKSGTRAVREKDRSVISTCKIASVSSIDAGEGKHETEKRSHKRREREKQKCHVQPQNSEEDV